LIFALKPECAVRKWIKTGKVKAFRIGGRVYVTKAALPTRRK
jgi:hypothetical protein